MIAARLFILTSAAMIAFAANSLLCRMALHDTRVDPATFTFTRIASGAIVLWLLALRRKGTVGPYRALEGNGRSALALFAYAAGFSFAYRSLAAGTGALLLFAAVQVTMILYGFWTGDRLNTRQVVGLSLASLGLVILVLPGVSAPPIVGSTLMLGAGVAWGIYSLRGRTAGDPVRATAGNFVRAAPLALLIAGIALPWAVLDLRGLEYAVVSGVVASGIGYVIWYSALPRLRPATAATVQLSVPVLAAVGGILLLGEPVTFRFVFVSITVLGGIALILTQKRAQLDPVNTAKRV